MSKNPAMVTFPIYTVR